MDGERIALETPVGTLDVVVGEKGLRVLSFRDEAWDRVPRRRVATKGTLTSKASVIVAALDAYFAGETEAIDRIPVDPEGTPFQLRVWKALRKVPTGCTISYSKLAEKVGSPSAVRAVALCNARNPIALVVPCHRVIGKDGSLTGYGGGLDRKRWLLEHEGALLPTGDQDAAGSRTGGEKRTESLRWPAPSTRVSLPER